MVSRKKRIKIIKGKVKAQARKNNREGQVKKKVGTEYIYPVTGHVVGLDTETRGTRENCFQWRAFDTERTGGNYPQKMRATRKHSAS